MHTASRGYNLQMLQIDEHTQVAVHREGSSFHSDRYVSKNLKKMKQGTLILDVLKLNPKDLVYMSGPPRDTSTDLVIVKCTSVTNENA